MERIRKGDEVVIIAGRDKGKRGTVLARVDERHLPRVAFLGGSASCTRLLTLNTDLSTSVPTSNVTVMVSVPFDDELELK